MKPVIVSLFFLFLAVFFPQSTFAQESWVINNFQSTIGVQRSGEVKIEEQITVDFYGLEKHGIFRDIPYIYRDGNEATYTEIDVTNVFQDDQKAEYEVSTEGDTIRIKVGDPDKTISGKHQYTISYVAKGVLRRFNDYDELYWNVTGNYWEAPIQKASATVWLPQDIIRDTLCFQGIVGSKEPCGTKTQNGTRADFASRELQPGEGLTVVVSYDKNVVPVLTVARPKTFWEKFIDPLSLSTLIISILFGLGTIEYIWYKYGRDYWFANAFSADKSHAGSVKPMFGHETIVVEFEAPEKLRPAELGVVVDERAHTHDVTATIIDLATRGFLTITEIPKKWLFGSIDYELTEKKKDTKELVEYEKHLLDELFKNRSKVKISELKLTFYDELAEVKKKLYEEVLKKGLFPSNPENVRGKYLLLAIGITVLGFIIILNAGPNGIILLFDIGVGILVSGLVFLILSQNMPRRTAYGREVYRKIKGYRLFLSGAEKYRQQFYEKKNLFNEVLPYVIVFGLTGKFAKAMKDMGIKPTQPTWYHSTAPFNTASFGNSMSTFASSVGSAIAATPSKGGGFSGGGSSGGGFGGGGGGSW